MSNIRMFSLNSIGCVTKCGPAGTWREIQPTDVCKANVLKFSTERFEVTFNRLDEEQAHGATK